MPFVLDATLSTATLKSCFDQDFDTDKPMDHIHGAVLNFCNPGFDKPRTRAAMHNLTIDLSSLAARYSNIDLLFRESLADGQIKFRPDTPLHGNDEGRYPGGKLSDRIDNRPRHFEFGAVGGGMRVVFDNDTEELYISAHYSYPGMLVATAGSKEASWLMTVKARLNGECAMMEAHSEGATRKTRDEIERLRAVHEQGRRKGVSASTLAVPLGKIAELERSLQNRAVRNHAFTAWMRDPQSQMTARSINDLYGI